MYDWPPILGSDNTPLTNPLKRTPNCTMRIVRDGNQEPAMTLTPEQTDVDAIIAGLSEAERVDFVLAHCALPANHHEWMPDCICSSNRTDEWKLRGLAVRASHWPPRVIFTPLGLAVRDKLEADNG